MAERTKSVGEWIRGLVGKREKTPTPDESFSMLGEWAVEACESLVANAICRTAGPTRRWVGATERITNAFNETLTTDEFDNAPAALAAAAGFCMSGLRVAVLLPADQLVDCAAQLRSAVQRHLPLVLQTTAGPGSGQGIDAAVTSGAMVFVARNAQEACDLTFAARLAAERSLTPCMVVQDAAESAWTVAQVALPDATRVRELVGDPASEVESPTRAQSLLFGERRRRLPRWFDLDQPLASGVRMPEGERNAAAAARQLLFAAQVAAISAEALETVAAFTGRPLGVVRGHGLDEARRVIVGTGSILAVAEAVSDRLGRDGGSRGGVLGLTRLAPFPYEEVREALSRADVVTVLERHETMDASLPLLEGVRAAVTGRGTRLLRAYYQRPVAGELAAVYANMKAGAATRESVTLGLAQLADAPDHPRRQARVQRTRRDCPDLDQAILDDVETLDLRPRDARTVVLRVGQPELPERPLKTLAVALRESVGQPIAGRTDEIEPGVWQIQLTASVAPFGDPGAELPADVVLIEHPGLLRSTMNLAKNATVVVAGGLDGAELWNVLPLRGRRMIRRGGSSLYGVTGIDELIATGAALAGGGPLDKEPVGWTDIPPEGGSSSSTELPLVVRRLGSSVSGPASVARFWGEFAQPRIEALDSSAQPDPDLALGTMPVCTAGFHAAEPGTGLLPEIDPSRCTACGKCWTSCPDSAIGVVALGPQALLDAAAELSSTTDGGEHDAVAGKLKRAHGQLAARWAANLSGSEPGAVEIDSLDDAFGWLIDKMKVSEEERPGFKQAFAGTVERIAALPLGHSAALFHDLESEDKGSGAFHLLAVDSRSCQGCGICAAVCEDDAIDLVTRGSDPDRAAKTRVTWNAWEQLPDTSGKLIARASEDSRIGPLASILLSRHCLLSLSGGAGAEPGSGERIAVRQVTAVVEYQMQRRRLAQVKQLEELTEKLRERITLALSKAVSLDDLASLDQALDVAPSSRAPLGPVMEKLEELGQRTDVDVQVVRRLVRTTQNLEETTASITHGLSGAGRARYGVVLSGRAASAWAGTFPWNPFSVPVAVDSTGAAAELALGLAHGFTDQAVREARLARRAELLLDAPSDLPARERELDRLDWSDLTTDERRVCAPILVFGDQRPHRLEIVLASDLPVKTVLLDSLEIRDAAADPLLPAIARRSAYAAGSSPAYPDQLFESITGALDFGGPALLQIHSPSPSRHGFATEATIERASLAVLTRVNPLIRFDPPAGGGLGQGLKLDGNPSLEDTWALDPQGEPLTPATWATGESRFAGATDFPAVVDQRARHWATLQELAGVAAPFADRIAERIRRELETSHKTELDALREEYEVKLREEEARQTRTQATKLKERLMQLAGFRGATGLPTRKEDDS